MEKRPYFVFGDLVSNALPGALAGLAVAAVVGPRWYMPLGMLVGMILGMMLTLLVGPLLMILFGGPEVMLPCMLTGMVAGMYSGMAGAMRPLTLTEGAAAGALAGLAVIVLTYALNARVNGIVRERKR